MQVAFFNNEIPTLSGFLPALPTGRQAAGWSSATIFRCTLFAKYQPH
jgi:hypothetical protein